MAITFQRPEGQPPTFAAASATPPVVLAARAVSPAAADVVTQQRTMAGTILVELYEYLSANVPQHPALAPAIPALSDAVAQYRAGLGGDPFAGARAVYAVIQRAQAVDPSIPPA